MEIALITDSYNVHFSLVSISLFSLSFQRHELATLERETGGVS